MFYYQASNQESAEKGEPNQGVDRATVVTLVMASLCDVTQVETILFVSCSQRKPKQVYCSGLFGVLLKYFKMSFLWWTRAKCYKTFFVRDL